MKTKTTKPKLNLFQLIENLNFIDRMKKEESIHRPEKRDYVETNKSIFYRRYGY